MSDLHMTPDEVVDASTRLRSNSAELWVEPKLDRASGAMARMAGSEARSAWSPASGAIGHAVTRFRDASDDLETRLVASARAYAHHEQINVTALRAIEA